MKCNKSLRPRRSKGEGSIVQRKDGSWLYAIDLGKNEEGRRQRRYIYAPTTPELKRKVADLKARNGGQIRPRIKGTVGEWVERWLEEDVRTLRSRNTYALYELVWRIHAKPVIGGIPLENLDAEDVSGLYAQLRKKKASPTIIHRVGVVMQRAVAVATRRGVFHRVNPFTMVERPTPKPKVGHDLTIEEARRFLAVARDDQLSYAREGDRLEELGRSGSPKPVPLEGLFVLLLTSGLRLGEALGLEWRDVDFERGRISVRQALTEVNGVVEIGEPKTRGSRRPVELGALAIAALDRRRDVVEAEGHGSKLVFSTPSGTPLRRSNIRNRHFDPLLKRGQIPKITIHGLRHAMTSFGIASGVAPKILAERLGHSTVRLTQDRYAHVLPGMQRQAAEAIEDLLQK